MGTETIRCCDGAEDCVSKKEELCGFVSIFDMGRWASL